MPRSTAAVVALSLLLAGIIAVAASASSAGAPHPQGKVVFQDDLEKGVTFAADDAPGWHIAWRGDNVSVEEDSKIARSGRKCLRVLVPNRDGNESGAYYSIFLPEPYGDVTWVSYWIKYAQDFDQGPSGMMHSCEVVINNKNASPEVGFASANFTADGTNFAKSGVETQNGWPPTIPRTTPPGYVTTNWAYTNLPAEWYWTGTVPTRGEWHHVLLKIRLNDPGRANGYMDLWYDDQLLGHFYGQDTSKNLHGLIMRTTPDLVVRSFWPGAYVHHAVKDNMLWLDDITITTGRDAPAAPRDLRAEKGGKGVKLTWEAVPGAKGYYIYRSETREQAKSTPFMRQNTCSVTAASFEDTGGSTPSTAWMVTAIMPQGESVFSSEARVQ